MKFAKTPPAGSSRFSATATPSDTRAVSSSPTIGIPAATVRSPGRTCTSAPTSRSAIGGSERFTYRPAPVGLEQVVALAIVELGVEPLRDDWERLIDEAADR